MSHLTTGLWLIALAVGGVLIWQKKAPKLLAAIALAVGTKLGLGRVGGWAATAINWIGNGVGHLANYLFSLDVDEVTAGVSAALGVACLLLVVIQMWPKKGKASLVTAGAALVLPLFWAAVVAAVNQVSPGIVGG